MRRLSLAVVMILVGGCDGGGFIAADARELPDADPSLPFQRCTGRAFTPAPDQDWRHDTQTPITTSAGAANHSSQDQIDNDGWTVTLPGKFAYGAVSADLEDELVRVSIDDCTGWRELGDHATSSDGRIFVPVPPGMLDGPGEYETRFQVLGDGSMTASSVWVLPRGTRLALTDIDGTMTQSDSELFQQMYDGSHVPVPYPGAVDLTTAHAGRGHVVLYLTGRPYWLTRHTRTWLTDLAFEPGPLHVTDSNSEAVPSESGVGAFKRAYIQSLLDAGYQLDIDVAYGNATTDIYAYLGAGLPAGDVWIIGDHAGEQGTNAATGSWTPRVIEVEALPMVTQPFQR